MNFAPQNLIRIDRLFIEARNGVTMLAAKVGNQPQFWSPVSTLFYSVPSNPKTLQRIMGLIAELKTREPDKEMMRFVWDSEADPDSAMGLPVRWDTAEVGNQISMLFHNRSSEPVRLVIVLRGTIPKY